MDAMVIDEGQDAVAETGDSDTSDLFQTVIAILIAIVAVAGAVTAWRASLIDGEAGVADFVGLQAAINAAETKVVNTTALYRNYRAYTNFTYNRELAGLLDKELNTMDTADIPPELVRETVAAAQLASDNEGFFSKRYLNQDGSYNRQRDLGEAWATSDERLDLDPTPHFASADQGRNKVSLLIAIFIVQAAALLLLTVAQTLHSSRNVMRYSLAGLGTVFLVFTIVAAVIIERS